MQSLWAASCVLFGMVPAARLLAGLFIGGIPAWYPAIALIVGVAGITLVAGSFTVIHRERTPWYLLGAATLLLVVNLLLVPYA